jgi:hypothetical protein
MPSATSVFGLILAFLAVGAGAIYLFGIPPWLKREMEEKALETMGENKMSYMMKDSFSKIPTSDQKVRLV